MMSIRSQFQYGSTKEIELYRHFCCHCWIYYRSQFMGGEYTKWIVPEV